MRLGDAWTRSREQLEPFRRERMDKFDELVGTHYSANNADDSKKMPISLLSGAALVYQRNLVASRPRANTLSRNESLRPYAYTFELALNKMFGKMALEQSIMDWVFDAIFTLGIIKVGEYAYGDLEVDNQVVRPTRPYAKVVDLDNWCHDAAARKWTEINFCGHLYDAPLDWAKGNELFDEKARKQIQQVERKDHDEDTGERRAESLSVQQSEIDQDLSPQCRFREEWLPGTRLIITVPDRQPDLLLRVVEYDGPEHGPYNLLRFNTVPMNIMPFSPLDAVIDMHKLANALFHKLGDQALAQKTNYAIRPTNKEDAEKLANSRDQQFVETDDPASVNAIRMGGADQVGLAMFLTVKDLFSQMGGNIDLLAGLSPQSPTATQDELLSQGANARMEFMRDRVIAGTRQVMESIAHHVWEEPLEEIAVDKPIPGIEGMSVPANPPFAPWARQGAFADYDIELEPYSLRSQTPEQVVKLLFEVHDRMMSNPQGMAAGGVGFDYSAFMKHITRLLNRPELADIIVFADGQDIPGLTENESGGAPTQRHTVNERVSRPGGTERGKNRAQVEALMGMNPQGENASALMRMTG